MKAVVVTQFGGPEVLSYEEVPDPRPGEGQVLIKAEASSVNFADIKQRTGTYHSGGQPPVIPGLDVAGTVVALGPGVTGLQVGQRVGAFCNVGGYAEYVVAPAALAWSVPEGVDIQQAAAFPTIGVTAYNILEYVRRGELRFPIGGLFPLSEAAEAHRLLESRQSTGKLLLLP